MKSKRKLLVSSMIMILTCCLLFAGSTFAWFSDSVTSNNNIIKAGNLDVELEYSTDGEVWEPVEASTQLFDEETLWEPGHTEAVLLRVSNAGSLALKYSLKLNVVDEVSSVNVNDEEFNISDYLVVGAKVTADKEIAAVEDRANAKVVAKGYEVGFSVIEAGASLLKGEDSFVQLVVYMPETVGNEANYKKGAAVPQVTFGITLYATQATAENDSFGPDYDAAAPWVGGVDVSWYNTTSTSFTLKSAEELAGLAAIVNGTANVKDDFKGKTIYLGADLDLNNIEWTPIGNNPNPFKGNFDGQNHTVYNLVVNNEGWAGLIGHAGKAAGSNVKNLKVVNASITSNRMAGVIVGQLYGSIDNCHVANANINVVPNLVDGKYDNGDKVGGIVGWLGDNGNNRTLTNCTVENATIKAYRDLGGIVGYAATSTSISKNSVKNVSLTSDQNTNYYGKKDANVGAICGRYEQGKVTFDNNTSIEVTTTSKYTTDGIQYVADPQAGETKLYLVPASYEGDTVVVPEGVTTIGGYAFAYNTSVDTIELSSTVTTLADRAFRDTSASEVILNEGLENISYQAFRNATNVKSVVIPSTVKTISKEAFQNSGVTELVIPEGVETIEYGGLRDMKELVSVTIHSDATIPAYGFRSCTNLKTVVITNPNITFENGMIFSHYDTGLSSGLTIYVPTEEVKARLQAADTSARYYTIVVASLKYTAEEIVEAAANGEYILLGSDINATLSLTNPYGNKGAFVQHGGVIDGNGHSIIINNTLKNGFGIETYGGTIKNLVLTTAVERGITIYSPTEDIIIDNVIIDGPGYAINTKEHAAKKLIVTNSTVNGWTSLAGLEIATFTNCKLGMNTNAYWQHKGYNDPDYDRLFKPYNDAVLINCELEQLFYLDLSSLVSGCHLTLDNCTVNGVKITAENITNYLTVELSGGRTIADCIIFR